MRIRARHAARVLAASVLAAMLLAACAPADEEPSGSAAQAPNCAKDQLQVRTQGKLTIGTDKPAYEPWFKNDDPSNGQGFESAVAYAVAEKLGFSKEEVTWVVAPFNTLIQPGEKQFDFAINQVSISEERKQAVDFSSGYYDVTQAVIALNDSKIANATSIADLKDAKLGAAVGTTSYQTIVNVVQPNQQPAVFDNNDVAKAALANGQIDGLFLDLPTAFYMTAAEIENSKIVGQFEQSPGGEQEQFGLVLTKGSPLTQCVTKAVDDLRADGTLKRLADEWLSDTVGAPVLR